VDRVIDACRRGLAAAGVIPGGVRRIK
jgi:hypothetical protein